MGDSTTKLCERHDSRPPRARERRSRQHSESDRRTNGRSPWAHRGAERSGRCSTRPHEARHRRAPAIRHDPPARAHKNAEAHRRRSPSGHRDATRKVRQGLAGDRDTARARARRRTAARRYRCAASVAAARSEPPPSAKLWVPIAAPEGSEEHDGTSHAPARGVRPNCRTDDVGTEDERAKTTERDHDEQRRDEPTGQEAHASAHRERHDRAHEQA